MRINPFLFFLNLLFIGCSIKKNQFLSKNYHQIKVTYNGLFHAQKLYKEISSFLIQNQEEVLLGYLFSFLKIHQKSLINDNEKENFQRDQYFQKEEFLIDSLVEKKQDRGDLVYEKLQKIEKKLLKVIENHSIFLDAIEFNSKIPEVYFLLGKVRYFQEKTLLARYNFAYFLDQFKNHSLVNEVKYWEAKTYLKLKNYDLSKEKINKLLEKEKISKKLKEDLFILNIEVFILEKKYEKSLFFIEKALKITLNKDKKLIYQFLKAGIYKKKGETKLAYEFFQKLAKKSDLNSKIRAYLVLVKEFDLSEKEREKVLFLLKESLEIPDFKFEKAFIYFEIGEIYSKYKNYPEAKKFYEKALEVSEGFFLQAKIYLQIAQNYLSQSKYKKSLYYYKEALQNMDETKEEDLENVRSKVNTIEKFFQYQFDFKEKELLIFLKDTTKSKKVDLTNKHIKWLKENEFLNENEIFYDLNYYLNKIPKNKDDLEVLKTQKNQIQFLIATYYLEKFEKKEKGLSLLKKMLNQKLTSRLRFVIYYNLYKILKKDKNIESEFYKNKIKNKFPFFVDTKDKKEFLSALE